MITYLEALAALARHGTMTRAALELRLTQSAVSKRIAALEAETRTRLIERDGRRVRLTSAGGELLQRAEPLLAQLRDAVAARDEGTSGRLAVGVSESVLASWGAPALAAARAAVPGLDLVLHAHRSPVAVDHVRSGEYALALVAGPGERPADLVVEALLEEELVIVPSGGTTPRRKARAARTIDVLSIEPGSATGRSVARGLAVLRRDARIDVRVVGVVQSFAGLVQMARAGFGAALVPLGIAQSMGVPARNLVRLPAPGLARTVSLVGRKTSLSRPAAAAFADALRAALPRGDGYRILTPSRRS